ncbi:DNA polymerase I-like isoform X2 [Daphnia magna]|uniref:DNA polymerase I-like isoform X2 n=1 Tax=Daphnia magna TaxID=35525 RepID=UPI001E1BC81A|nr:DNA polymerase I-like isoform X2 [Daphnia magna]
MAVCCLLNWALMAGQFLKSLYFKYRNYLAFGGLFSVGTSNIGAFERRRRFCSVLSQPDDDVFRGIVSVWKKKKQEEVRDDERQKAKQICYGIVYGMGCKSLAEQLEVGEEEAQLFVNTFHASYPSQPMWKKIQEENELSC